MSTADAAFRDAVLRDAVAAGWSPEVARYLAANAGKPQHRDAQQQQQRRDPVGRAPAVVNHAAEIAAMLRSCKLPASLQDDLRAARVLTFEAARSLCASVVDSANPKAALERLRLHLFAKARRT